MGNTHSSLHHRFRRRRADDPNNPDYSYTKPSGLYPSCAWDPKHVRRLILRRELAPRHPGRDDPSDDAQEECPICMLVYPVLNETKCCAARLCTECYLQIRPPRHNKQPCPFCKYKRIDASFNGPKDQTLIDRELRDEKRALEAMKRANLSSLTPTPSSPSSPSSSQPTPSSNLLSSLGTPSHPATSSSHTASLCACPPSSSSRSDLPPSDSSFCQQDHRARFYSSDTAPQLDPLLLEAMASEATYCSNPHVDRSPSSSAPSASASTSPSNSSLRDHHPIILPLSTTESSPTSSSQDLLLRPIPPVVHLPWYDVDSVESTPMHLHPSYSHTDHLHQQENVSLNEAIRRSLIDM